MINSKHVSILDTKIYSHRRRFADVLSDYVYFITLLLIILSQERGIIRVCVEQRN
jgi:hypothetical protein